MHSWRTRAACSLPYRPVSFQGSLCLGGLCPGGSLCQRDPLPRGQTDACENITLPQTSFADGNNWNYFLHEVKILAYQDAINLKRYAPSLIIIKFNHL